MQYFVYYNDDYADCCGVGFEFFEDQDKAISFIEERIKRYGKPLDCYSLVRGEKLPLEAKEVVLKVKIKDN